MNAADTVDAAVRSTHGRTMDMMPPPDGEHTLRDPPHSEQAEQALIGGLLQDASAMALVADLVTPASFYVYANRLIFGAIAAMLTERMAVDVITVYERLQAGGAAEDCGGLMYLNALAQCVPSSSNARRYGEIVAEKAVERALIAVQDEAARIAWDQSEPLQSRIERMSQALARVEQMRKSPGGSRVPLLSLSELKATAKAVRWLVKHVVPAESIGMMFGGSGTFKSFLALDCALHVAHGLPWMGRKTASGSVLYIAAEGQSGVWDRIDAWHRQRGLRWAEAPMYVVPAAIDLAVDAWRVVNAAQLVGVTPVMVVVDTLSQTYAGEENSANEMAAYLRELGARFRALWGCAVMLIHHSGHQVTERPRGSSAIRGNLDFLFGVFRDDKQMVATMTCIKQKDGDLFKDATFSLSTQKLGHDEDNDEISSLVARHLSSQDEIDQALAAEQSAGREGRHQMLLRLIVECNGQPEKVLRKAFYEGMPEIDAEAKKKAYYRHRAAAVRANLVEITSAGMVINLQKAVK